MFEILTAVANVSWAACFCALAAPGMPSLERVAHDYQSAVEP